MTDREPIALLHTTFGGSFSTYGLPSGKTVYCWRVSHRKAQRAAVALLSYSQNPAKHVQLGKVLAHYAARDAATELRA